MKTITSIEEMKKWSRLALSNNKSIGFVATMGCLHEGHLSLIKTSTEECDNTVVSIFVNQTQFSPEEDFDSYPRNIKSDKVILQTAGVDIMFNPNQKDFYPEEFQSFIDRLSQVEEFSLDEKAKKLFNDIMVDMFDQPIELEHKIPQPELNRRIQYLEKLAQVGFAELKNDYSGKQVSSSAVVSGYKNLIENYSDDDNYRVAATELEKIMSPLHEIG